MTTVPAAVSQPVAPRRRPPRARAFTLVEVLVVIAIVGLLAAITLPVLARSRDAARTARDQKAGVQLITAYHLYANDHRGSLMPGYATSAMTSAGSDAGKLIVADDAGSRIYGVTARRYPWRIAPYLDYNFLGLYDPAILERYKARADFQYVVSLSPAMGINADYVGGKGEPGLAFNPAALAQYGRFYITRADEARAADKLIVFATSRGVDPDGGTMPGYHEIAAPALTVPRWTGGSAWTPDESPEAFGHLDLRAGRGPSARAATTMIDGHGELLGLDDLRDMRRWANGAARPDWVLSPK